MRLSTTIRFDATFEVWSPVMEGTTLTYKHTDDGKALLVPVTGGTVNLLTRDSLDLNTQVRNVRDREGNLVFQVNGEAYPMYVNAATPQMNVFGVIEGWTHTLKRTLPRDFLAEFTAVMQG